MTIGFRSTVSIEMGEDNWQRTAFKRTNIQRLESYTESASGVESVAAAATRSASLGGITTAKVLYIEATGAIGVSINGLAVIPLAPATGETASMLFDGASITSVAFTNAGGDSVIVRWAAAGA